MVDAQLVKTQLDNRIAGILSDGIGVNLNDREVAWITNTVITMYAKYMTMNQMDELIEDVKSDACNPGL